MLHNETLDVILLNVYKKVCSSCAIYIILFAYFSYQAYALAVFFIDFHWYFKKDNVCIKFNPTTRLCINGKY